MVAQFGVIAICIAMQQPTPGMPSPSRPDGRPSGLMVGQVVDATSGRPVPNVIVSLSGMSGGRGGPQPGRPSPVPRLLTGRDGRFVFRDLPAGSFGVSATKIGYTPSGIGVRRPGGPSQQLTLADGERVGDVTVRMWKQGSISGSIVDETGEPLVGTRVRAFRRGGLPDPQRLNVAGAALTDDRGVYRISLLDAGEYVVGVVARTVGLPVDLAKQNTGVQIPFIQGIGQLPVPGTASGIQLSETVVGFSPGAPIPPAPKAGVLMVYPPAFYPSVEDPAEAVRIAVAPGEEREAVDLQLHPVPTTRVSGVLAGNLNDAGMLPVRLVPLGGMNIAVDGDLPGTITLTDRAGAFTFASVPAGDYVLRASTRAMSPQTGAGDMQYAEHPVTVGNLPIEGLGVALTPGRRITGSLHFEGSSPRPSDTVLGSVALAIEPAGTPASRPPVSAVRASKAGEFEATGLPPGRYFVRAAGSPPGWMFKSATLNGRDVADTAIEMRDSDALGIVITFSDRWSGLSGTVQGPNSSQDPDALVLVFPTDPQTWNSSGSNPRRIKSVRPSKNGHYAFDVLPPGDYLLAAVPDHQAADWRDPRFLETLAPYARQVTIRDGERKTQDVRTREVR